MAQGSLRSADWSDMFQCMRETDLLDLTPLQETQRLGKIALANALNPAARLQPASKPRPEIAN